MSSSPSPASLPKKELESGIKPKIIASAFISSAPKKVTKKRPAPSSRPNGSCHKFWSLGRCEYGDECKYGHTANPDVPAQLPPPALACKKFWVDGRCDYGDKCKFPHQQNPLIDVNAVEAENKGMSYKKAMKLGGSALDLNRWMDPKQMENYCAAPPADGVVFHGTVQVSKKSQPADGVDAPSEDIEAELAALQRMVAPQVLAKVKRQLEQIKEGSAETVTHTCTCHLMPGFDAETGEKLVLCFNCNTAALEDKKKSVGSDSSNNWTPEPLPAEEDAPGEEKAPDGTAAMAAILDRIDGARASSSTSVDVPVVSGSQNTWAEWEQWQKDNGLDVEGD